MATREEIISGLEFTIAQAKRTTALFADGEWDQKRSAGWTPKELYAHLAATAGIVPGFAQGPEVVAQVPERGQEDGHVAEAKLARAHEFILAKPGGYETLKAKIESVFGTHSANSAGLPRKGPWSSIASGW